MAGIIIRKHIDKDTIPRHNTQKYMAQWQRNTSIPHQLYNYYVTLLFGGVVTMSRSFLILYGVGGSEQSHWQSWLYRELVKQGEKVYFPDFPDKDQPIKDVWLKHLSFIFEKIPQNEEVTVVAHSLACIMWFHYAASHPRRKAKRAILVSLPSPYLQYEPVMTFFPLPEDKHEVANVAEKTLFVLSSTDPYCSLGDAYQYLDLGVPCVILPKMGHINVESGYGPWQWILDVCLFEKGAQI